MADTNEEKKDRLADTNMENYGGDEHRKKQQEIAKKQKEWIGAGQKEGIEVWRIEKFKVIKQKDETHGDFFNGDSYIVLNTYKAEDGDSLLYNVHFWLGKDTSQDEAGSAAIKTVELDDLLGDLPVQYREVQGHERKLFTDLFPAINILEGGVDSGFRHVEPKTYKPRLLHVAGKPKKMRIDEVGLSHESLNDNDAFVLDMGDKIYQFRPPSASAWEKQASNKFVNDLKSSRHGKVKESHLIGWGDETPESKEFWKQMGLDGQPDELPKTSIAKQKEADEKKMYDNWVNKMYHVTDESGEMTVKLVQEGKLDKAILKEEDDDVLIVDVGIAVFVWVGKTANKEELRHSVQKAQEYLQKEGRPMWTPIERVFSGRETSAFKKCFGTEKVPRDII